MNGYNENTIGAVVLNYNNYSETKQCVESLLKQKNVKMHIVIVDNGSKNDSLSILQSLFSQNENVIILDGKINNGYARGNNIGINCLREKKIDFILICNSDVTLSTPYIVSQMLDYNHKNVGCIIPIIKNIDGSLEMRAQYKRRLGVLRIYKELERMIRPQRKVSKSPTVTNSKYFVLEPGIQDKYIVITGSMFALTPCFFKYYNGLYPETFLYVEELATLLLLLKVKLKTAIADTDTVIHKGAASTDVSLKPGTSEKNKMVTESAKAVKKLILMPKRVMVKKY